MLQRNMQGDKMNTQTRNWLLGYLAQHNGNVEACSKWMARTFPGCGGVKFYRAQLVAANA